MSRAIEVTVTGRIEVLRLEPGDVIVVTVMEPISADIAEEMKQQVRKRFPEHEVMVCDRAYLSVLREGVAA